MNSATESVCFSISGSFLTDHCRSLWAQEDRADHALKTLMVSLHGITHEQAISILEGHNKLVGNSSDDAGLRLVPDKSKKKVKLPTLQETLKRLTAERDEARDDCADVIQLHLGETVGLGSPGGLRKVPRRKTENRNGVAGARRVLKKGYEFPDQPEETREKGAKELKFFEETEQSKYSVARSKMPAPKMVEAPEEEEEEVLPPPVAHDEIDSDIGWLSPEGKFYPCSYTGHIELASRLSAIVHLGSTSESTLEDKGWVKLCRGADGQHHIFGFLMDCKARPTEIQIRMVTDFCLMSGFELPYWAQEG
jgi:hypothetical protein